MIIFSSKSNATIDIWKNTIFSNFMNNDEFVKMQYLSAVVDVFGFDHARKEQEYAAKSILEFMENLSIKKYFHLENVYRRWNYEWESHKRKAKEWDTKYICKNVMKLQDEEARRMILILCSMHSDGYVRQESIQKLIQYKNSLPFLLMRLNDWVKQVRESAFITAMERISKGNTEELLFALPVFEKLDHSYRKDKEAYLEISNVFHKKLKKALQRLDFSEIESYDQMVKNAYCRLINQYNIYSKQQLCQLLNQIKGSYESRMIVHALVKHYGMNEQEFQKYIKCKNNIIRRYVIEQWTAKNGLWEGAEKYLMDPSKSVRSNIQFLLGKHTNFDITQYYILHLKSEKKKIAIAGLGETSGKEVIGEILPFLEEEDWRIQRVSLQAIGSILRDEGKEYYLLFLQNKNIVLVKTAYQQSLKWGVIYGKDKLIELYYNAKSEQQACYFLYLLGKEPFWKCLPFYFTLFGRVSKNQQEIIEREVYFYRPMFQRLSIQLKNEIEQAIEKNRDYLPEELCKEIKFDLAHL